MAKPLDLNFFDVENLGTNFDSRGLEMGLNLHASMEIEPVCIYVRQGSLFT